VESAKHLASQPKNNFLIGDADAVCNQENSTSVIEMLGLDNLEAISPQQWFQNPCGPLTYRAEVGELKTKKKRRNKNQRSPSNGRDESSPPTAIASPSTNEVGKI
jgi:hypothetical protein